jgi:hypothetical protein
MYSNFICKNKKLILVFVCLAIVLLYVTPLKGGENASMLQAKELLLGKPYLPEKISWIEMLEWKGNYYIAYPPMVTFLVLPYVFLNGKYLGAEAINSAIIFGSAILIFFLVKKLKGINQWASLATIAYVLGTVNLRSAQVGSIWLLMHSLGNFFFLLSICFLVYRKSCFWTGFFFAIAFQVRYAILSAILVFPIYSFLHFKSSLKKWDFIYFILGLLCPCLLVWIFQFYLFGNPFLSAYSIIFEQWGIPHIFSLDHFYNNFKLYLFGMPKLLSKFPYLQFDYFGQAMWTISPFLLGVLFLNLRHKFVWAFFPSAIIMFVTYLFYYHSGMTQYGTRYVQDVFPILIPLSFAGFSHHRLWIRKLLPVMVWISVLLNLYIVAFNKFD